MSLVETPLTNLTLTQKLSPEEEEEEAPPADNNAPELYTPQIASLFSQAKTYLDAKRDKEEEVTRLSKDTTWEAKRIIYVLHRFITYPHCLTEARRRIKNLLNSEKYFYGLALALEGQDNSMHYRRYTNCVQEYIEAAVFLNFLQNRKIPTYEEVMDTLKWEVDGKDKKPDGENNEDPSELNVKRVITVPLSLNDYILGICDFTGELMKAAIPTLTKAKWHIFLAQSFCLVREVYANLLSIYTHNREFRKKLSVMRASVMKIEATVYRLKIKFLLYGKIPESVEDVVQQGVVDNKRSDSHHHQQNSNNDNDCGGGGHDSGLD